MLIELSKLHGDARNSNVCPPELMDKIERLIQRTGQCPPLIVRPHPIQMAEYILIDGHHRLHILQKLGWLQIECQVWDINEAEAGLALATINRLRGTDDILKRAELIDALKESISIPELSTLLPETESEIEDLLALLKLDEAAIEKTIKDQIEAEKALLPTPFTFMIPASEVKIVEEALNSTADGSDRSKALVVLCRHYLELKQRHA